MAHGRALAFLMLSALTGNLVAVVAAAEPTKAAGQVMAITGPVTVTRPDVTHHPLKFRDNLYWRDVVDAHKDGLARVLLGGKWTVTVRELSRLELREEKRPEGIRYVADLVSGKMRASVARMLMRPGEQVEVWTWNTVASVRGTDFIVETVEQPAQLWAFALLGIPDVAQGVADGGFGKGETVIVTLSGVVDVSNRLSGTDRMERVGAYEAVRVSGRQDPVRFQVSPDQMKVYLQGLTPPRPQEARSGDKAEAVRNKVEVALAASAQIGEALKQADHDGRSQGRGQGHQQGSQSGSNSGGQSSALALGQSTNPGSHPGKGLVPQHANRPDTSLFLSKGKLGNKGNK